MEAYINEKVFKAKRELQHAEAVSRWVPASCPHCGTPIPYEKRGLKFCNHSCAASFNNRGVQHNKPKPPVNPEGRCLFCGKNVLVTRMYCNTRCLRDADRGDRVAAINLSGDLWAGWKHERSIRDYLLQTQPNECSTCHRTEWEGSKIPLVMDHIDGNPENWMRDNLRLLCPNCDAQTATYLGRNRGKGRRSCECLAKTEGRLVRCNVR